MKRHLAPGGAVRRIRIGPSVRFTAGFCPQGCRFDDIFTKDLPKGVIYRSSQRSVTLRCEVCGLLCTMTFHQLAKAAAILPDRYRDQGRNLMADMAERWATNVERWAKEVGDTRGRAPQDAPQRHS